MKYRVHHILTSMSESHKNVWLQFGEIFVENGESYLPVAPNTGAPTKL